MNETKWFRLDSAIQHEKLHQHRFKQSLPQPLPQQQLLVGQFLIL